MSTEAAQVIERARGQPKREKLRCAMSHAHAKEEAALAAMLTSALREAVGAKAPDPLRLTPHSFAAVMLGAPSIILPKVWCSRPMPLSHRS